jgi:hypothetical protein
VPFEMLYGIIYYYILLKTMISMTLRRPNLVSEELLEPQTINLEHIVKNKINDVVYSRSFKYYLVNSILIITILSFIFYIYLEVIESQKTYINMLTDRGFID